MEKIEAREYVKDELEARGWTVEDLANRMEFQVYRVNEFLNGKMRITKLFANGLSNAFGTSIELWLNLDRASRNEEE